MELVVMETASEGNRRPLVRKKKKSSQAQEHRDTDPLRRLGVMVQIQAETKPCAGFAERSLFRRGHRIIKLCVTQQCCSSSLPMNLQRNLKRRSSPMQM